MSDAVRVLLDATALSDRFSGARARISGLYPLIASRRNVELTVVMHAGAGLARPFEEAGARVISMPSRPEPWMRAFKILNPLARRADRPRLFDLFDAQTLPLPGMRHVPLAVTIHDLRFLRKDMAPWFRRLFARILLGRSLMKARAVITVSQAMKEEMLEAFPRLKEDRVHVVHNAVPPLPEVGEERRGSLLKALNIVPPYLLCLGHLEPRKNLWPLLEAASRFPMGLVLAGEAKPGFKASVIDRCTTINRARGEEAVRWLGPVSQEEKAALLQSAHAAVQPSLYEGFGIGVLEALSARVPLACSRIPAHCEAAGDGAIYFDPRSQEDLEGALKSVAFDEGLRSEMIRACKEKPRPFSWTDSAERLAEIWSGIVR